MQTRSIASVSLDYLGSKFLGEANSNLMTDERNGNYHDEREVQVVEQGLPLENGLQSSAGTLGAPEKCSVSGTVKLLVAVTFRKQRMSAFSLL